MNSNNSYIAGYKLNYSTDTDNSTNSVRSSNASLITSIQQIDLKNSADIKPTHTQEDATERDDKLGSTGYFGRLKFNTSSFLRKKKNINTSGNVGNIPSEKRVLNNNQEMNRPENSKLSFTKGKNDNNYFNRLKPSDGIFLSFLKTKKGINSQQNKKNEMTVLKNDYEFLDRMTVSERCRISIECKNNAISIEGHKKCK